MTKRVLNWLRRWLPGYTSPEYKELVDYMALCAERDAALNYKRERNLV